ncbi:Uncharacterized conserved protein, DUF305 family [Sinosporangium album]|uniref:Uncharacterized conserved protein, DUF305 family n=1 Tax=Sinosporangium album TaxID=504805 RepID=A0A1G7ZL81_9ACTN|nr:DUF305 domain-containing protein [Sinosporangium album]SDH09347.1 Uncharacterized conserved protein, DUF305 family [Sinosporangium album]
MRNRSKARGFSAAVLAAFALAGCTDSASTAPAAPEQTAPVIVPGGPGGESRTAQPGETPGPAAAGPSAADVRFAESMIPHHRQALEMSALVADRTQTPSIRALADRIATSQGPEIAVMSDWLTRLGRAVPAHGHKGDMPGMAALEEMNRLRGLRGAEFNRYFLELMITHHQGALGMAADEMKNGTDQGMRRIAKDVYHGQNIEIARMKNLSG